jgi:hypothetical protein
MERIASRLLAATVLGAAALLAPRVAAQTTDGFHTIQVIPLVVENASFASRFTFRNPGNAALSISATFFPATGVTPSTSLSCGAFAVPAHSDRTFVSLHALCPGLAGGTQFGLLHLLGSGGASAVFSAYSRVVNPKENGFTVEGFAANEFTSATATVAGLRRRAEAAPLPALQSNCFIGNLADINPLGSPVSTPFLVDAYDATGAHLGQTLQVDLVPGKIVRLLDVFQAVGAPAGDYEDARVAFSEAGPSEPAMVAFCTVQDNTSFGADFRIAKQEVPDGFDGNGAQDGQAQRISETSADVLGRAFELTPNSASSSNTHLMYFRHPDYVSCKLLDAFGADATQAYGLEMRLLAQDASTVIAGGAGQVGFGKTFLGNKADRNAGANTRYLIQVESNGLNTGGSRPYWLHCESGSGHGYGDLIVYRENANRF